MTDKETREGMYETFSKMGESFMSLEGAKKAAAKAVKALVTYLAENTTNRRFSACQGTERQSSRIKTIRRSGGS